VDLTRVCDGTTRSAADLIAGAEVAVALFPFDPHLRGALARVHQIVGE
jgi:hypothetical protein